MKKILLYLVLFLVILLLLPLLYFQFSACGISPLSCGDYTTKGQPITQKISVGSGPEDMALDLSTGTPRIIVSCDERREGQPDIGAFYSIDLNDSSTNSLQIIPADFEIHPHGIDVVTIDSQAYLYAISHDGKGLGTSHRILRFLINKDTLILDENRIFQDELMTGPNDLDVLEDGSFYVSNPMPSNDPMESTKSILGIKNGNVLHYDGKENWTIAVEGMCYPNGVWVNQEKGYLLVANGGCREVARYAIKNGRVDQNDKHSTKEHAIDIPIGDNLLMDNKGVLWTAAHPCPLKFLEHAKSPAAHSPMQVFAMDPMTLKTNMVFQNNGDLISAASTVLHWGNRLYISQVFDPFVLVVEGVD